MNADRLLEHYERIADAPDAIPRLRQFILDLAVRGKLVPQDPNGEPASDLLNRIAKEKARLVKAEEVRRDQPLPMVDQGDFPMSAPIGWALTRLAAISRRIHYGFTASADANLKDVRMLRITDIQDNAVDWSSVPGCVIDGDNVDQYKLEKGDILIARTGGTIGKTFLIRDVPVTAVFASYLIRIQGTNYVFDEYLKLFLESPLYWTQLRDGTRGTGQPNVNGQTLGMMILPLPPLAEQHRIVAKVDALMALCDRVEAARAGREATRDRLAAASLARLNAPDPANFQDDARFALDTLPALTTRPDQIKQLRQTILNLAVRGKLVLQDTNDEPASELLKRIADEKARLIKAGKVKKEKPLDLIDDATKPYDLPDAWEWVRLDVLTRLITKGSSPKWQGVNYVSADEGILFITSENVGNYELRKLDDLKYVESRFRDIEPRSMLKTGDILMNLVGASIGRAALYNLKAEANINQAVALVRLIKMHEGPYVDYLLHYFNSRSAIEFMLGSRVTTAQPNMSLTDAREFPVPLPPLAEQHRIVAKVDALMALCNRLEASLAAAATTRRRLLDALLAEALTPDDEREMEAAE